MAYEACMLCRTSCSLGVLSSIFVLGCAASSAPGSTEQSNGALPCGVRDCSSQPVGDDETIRFQGDLTGGKADATDVEAVIVDLVADGQLDESDVYAAFDACGDRVSGSEMLAIRDAVQSERYEVTDEALEAAKRQALYANLFDYEVEQLRSSNLSVGQHEIPAAVQELVARARLNGATAYDIRETDDDGEGKWSPYPGTSPDTENMAFTYTEITPEVLYGDLQDTTVEYNRIIGTEMDEYCDAAGKCEEYEKARLEPAVGGTGNIEAHYDHAYHPDIYARGRSGNKWASNCAILFDGSVHCLPAVRRNFKQDLILTNPALSRCNSDAGHEQDCKNLLYNGHITARAGVITSVEMSGRLSKRAGGGKAIFIDPLAILEAWGFEISPGVTLRYGNTEDGVPVRDLEQGVVRAQTP